MKGHCKGMATEEHRKSWTRGKSRMLHKRWGLLAAIHRVEECNFLWDCWFATGWAVGRGSVMNFNRRRANVVSAIVCRGLAETTLMGNRLGVVGWWRSCWLDEGEYKSDELRQRKRFPRMFIHKQHYVWFQVRTMNEVEMITLSPDLFSCFYTESNFYVLLWNVFRKPPYKDKSTVRPRAALCTENDDVYRLLSCPSHWSWKFEDARGRKKTEGNH